MRANGDWHCISGRPGSEARNKRSAPTATGVPSVLSPDDGGGGSGVGGGGDGGGGGPHGTVVGWERDIRWWEATCLRYPNVLSAHVTRSPTQGGGPAISKSVRVVMHQSPSRSHRQSVSHVNQAFVAGVCLWLPISPPFSFLFYSFVLGFCCLFFQSLGAVRKSRWPSWAPVPNKPTVSVDIKQHSTNKVFLSVCRRGWPSVLSIF